MTKRWDAVVVGQIYIDHVFSGLRDWPRPGEEIFTRNYTREVGGGAAITACGLALLERKTAVFGVVGDAEGDWIKRRLDGLGVDTSHLRQGAGSSGVTVSVSVGDDRSFYSYAGTNELLDDYLASPDLVALLEQASHVHFAVPLERRLAQVLVPALKAAGCSISLDVGWQPEWYGDPENLQTCREIDYFLPNQKEAQYLTGKQRPEDVLEGLERLGFTHVVVKLGSAGAAIHTGGRMLQVPSPRIQVVDTTGAGDAFDAGLIDAVLDGEKAEQMLQRAAACGALSTRMPGALMALATRSDLQEIYEQS